MFQRAYFEDNLQLGRACHLIAVFFYGLVAAWDAAHNPERITSWTLVFSLITVMFLIGFAASFSVRRVFARFWQPVFAFYVLATGSGFAVVTISSRPEYPLYNFVGIIFCLFFCYTFIRLTFVWASAAGTSIILIYTLATWYFVSPRADLLLNSLFYMTGINVLGMMISYFLELVYRRDFMLKIHLADAEAGANELNVQLEQRVKERTRDLVQANQALHAALEQEKKIEAARKSSENRQAVLEEQLIQAQKMESVGRLAGGVAHDYNNMISVIIGNAELGLEEVAPDHNVSCYLQEILTAARRSADITHQLLAFARKQTISPRVLDFNATVESMLKMLQRLIGEDINLIWQPGMDVRPVLMDPVQMDQILANLCVNARDAIADVGTIIMETGTFTMDEAYCDLHPGANVGDYVLLSVSDDGCGMDRETRANLFEPFFTTKAVGQGTGLGLATVFGIVKQNNGYINVYSEPGKGSVFRIYLPSHMDADTSSSSNMLAPVLVHKGETILVVEDEISILSLAEKILSSLGYRVITASDPVTARTLAAEMKEPISLLITDVIMPDMNGRELADLIKERHPAIKVLFMSGYTANVIAHHGVLDDDVQFMQKPFSISQISRAVRKALDGEIR